MPPDAREPSPGLYEWDVPGARVMLPFLSSDPLKDDQDWLEEQTAAMPRQDADREYLCDFTKFSGKPVFGEYRAHIHRSKKPLPFAPNRPIIRGWDIPGPLACVWMQLVPFGGVRREGELGAQQMRLHVLSELYANQGVVEFGRLVMTQSATLFDNPTQQFIDWADPAAWAKTPNDKRSCAELLRAECNIVLSPGPVDITSRLESVRKWLVRVVPTDNPNEPAGAILFDPSCVMLNDGIGSGYHYAEIEKSGRYKEVPEKNEYSHVVDALGYGCSRLDASAMVATKAAPKIEFTRENTLGAIG